MKGNLLKGRVTLLVVLSFAAPHIVAAPEQEATGMIAGLLTSMKELTQVPAYSVAIVRDGKLLAEVAVGEVDVRNHINATPENWLRLASISKSVGATMLAILVQEGKLNPDAPVGNYLPELPSQYRQLTAMQLLTHTAGMPHYQDRDANIAETHYDTAIAALASVGDRPLTGKPGSAYNYSSHGYTILSALYEAITETSLRESMPAFLATFTGRESPALEDLRQRNSRRSNVFEVTANGIETVKPRDQTYSPFGTGLVGSAKDLAYFGDAVLHSPVIDPHTRDFMFRPIRLDDGSTSGNYLYEVAFGWRVSKDPSGRATYHHSGVTQGARSALVLYPGHGLSIAFLSNAAWTAQVERTAFALADVVIEQQAPDMIVGEHPFTGSFNGQPIAGVLSCHGKPVTCHLSDDGGAFSNWLQQYLPNQEHTPNWPALPVMGASGRAIKIVTSVGIVDLQSANDNSSDSRFQAEIGNGITLELGFRSDRQKRTVTRSANGQRPD